jgi:hypothetical protein
MRLFLSVFTFLLMTFSSLSNAKDLDSYGAECKEIGFKPKTPAYGECVLELRKRDMASINTTTQSSTPTVKAQGDGSSGDATCQKYGFSPKTDGYSQCRLQIDNAARQFEAQQRQYEAQQAQYLEQRRSYDQQVAEQQAEKEKRKNLKLMELGFRMLGGQPIGDAAMATAGMAPIYQPTAPSRPAFENYTVTLPGNRTSYCSYDTTLRAMYCR